VAHIHRKTKTFLLRVAVTLAKYDLTDTNFARWSSNKNSRTVVPVINRFTGGPVGYNKQSLLRSYTCKYKNMNSYLTVHKICFHYKDQQVNVFLTVHHDLSYVLITNLM